MAYLSFPSVRIVGISACVPKEIDDNRTNPLIPENERENLVNSIGIMQTSDMLAVANLDLRVSPLKDFYISAKGGLMQTAETFAGMFETFRPDNWGASLGVGYDSIFGPLKLDLCWNQLRGWGYYLSLGYDF